MDNDNIYDKIQELFGNFPSNYSILEEQIDIDLQMEYFEHSKNFKDKLNSEEVINQKNEIFKQNIPIELKKEIFVKLASIENVEAFRAIEKYLENPDKPLKDWATLAFQESRMLLESKLLDTNQVFISTGLGGKGSKLRYFVVLISKSGKEYTNFQRKIIHNELNDILEKNSSELEKIEYFESYASLYAVIPMNVSIKDVFNKLILECNQYGDFLKENFIITNVKALSYDEIEEFIRTNSESETDNSSPGGEIIE
ncbi:MAG: hypothetical protein ACOCWG_02160 [bacterium]